MVHIPDQDDAGRGLLLEVTLQAKGRVAFVQEPLINRPVWRVTNHATLAHGFVLIHPRASLRAVTLEAGVVLPQEFHPAATHRLSEVCPAALDRISLVRVVTIRTTDPSLQYGMMMRQLKLGPYLEVTLETRLGRLAWIDNRARAAARFHMLAARPVAGFAPHIFAVLALSSQARVRGTTKVADNFFMAIGALFRSHKLSPGNTGRRHDRAIVVERTAGEHGQGKRGRAPANPKEFFTILPEPGCYH